MNIRVDLNYPIQDGTEVVFRSPVDCSQITGLKVYYLENGITTSKEFALADAHGNNVGDIDHLFAENVAVKVILDVTNGMAFVQNADTNAYLEGRFAEITDSANIILQKAGECVSVTDSSNNRFKGLTLYGKTTQDGTPAPDAPIELVSAGDAGGISVEITDGGDANIQSMVVFTPNGLPGVPVPSGGNYTDSNGQQWVCDEIDFVRGVYVQRIKKAVGSEIAVSDKSVVNDSMVRFNWWSSNAKVINGGAVSSHFKQLNDWLYSTSPGQEGVASNPTASLLSFFTSAMKDYDVIQFKNFLASQNVEIMYVLETPIETPLSAGELEAFALLHTYKPNTTAYTDSNAGINMEYVADTKTYIDNKFAELAAAIVANA